MIQKGDRVYIRETTEQGEKPLLGGRFGIVEDVRPYGAGIVYRVIVDGYNVGARYRPNEIQLEQTGSLSE